MLIATWNINSIRARQDRLVAWLAKHQPDVLCLQEVKVEEKAFPFDELREVGYTAHVHGQRTYNGVAILARTEPEDVERGIPDDPSDDPQARYIAASVQGIRVVSVYVPNGKVVGSESYEYKQRWLFRLKRYLEKCDLKGTDFLLCGDFNIVPGPGDVAKPEQWEGTVLYNPDMREEFSELLGLGLVDTVGGRHSEGGVYSWWDYRQLSFPYNNGLRIDHILASPGLAARCVDAGVDRDARKGKSPSDHAPVWARFGGLQATESEPQEGAARD